MGGRFGLVTIDPGLRAAGTIGRSACTASASALAGTQALTMDLPAFMKAFTDETAYAQVRRRVRRRK